MPGRWFVKQWSTHPFRFFTSLLEYLDKKWRKKRLS
jgi:hypothetical protein